VFCTPDSSLFHMVDMEREVLEGRFEGVQHFSFHFLKIVNDPEIANSIPLNLIRPFWNVCPSSTFTLLALIIFTSFHTLAFVSFNMNINQAYAIAIGAGCIIWNERLQYSASSMLGVKSSGFPRPTICN